MQAQCQAPYPDKYHKANEFYQAWPSSARQPRQDTLLLLFALSSQVEHGPCQDPKPSAWDGTKTAKWHAWSGLKDMSGTEAMRLFVKTLEEDEPNWYSYCTAGDEASVEAVTTPVGNPGLRSMPSDDCWRTPWVVAEKPPHPRFEHSCCLIGSTMYVFGGNTAGGRYLPDVWQLNLETLSWTDITTAFQKVPADPIEDEAGPSNGDASQAPATTVSSSFPASAAGVAIPHRGRALLVGGHSKDQKADPTSTLVVRVLDPARHTWGVLPCTGEVPAARGGHAAALIGDKVYVFGGEGARLRLQTGVTVLDLMTNEWSTLPLPTDARSAPEPRSSLVATSYQDRYLLLFGGGAVGKCHNDLWVLDTETGAWEQPPVSGPKPSARAGCSSALLGNRWYILGGGNNAAGCPDMWVLDLVKLGLDALEWKQVSAFDVRASLSSEGASLVAAPAYGALVAFGGYNGVFHNTVSVFKPAEAPENGVTGKWKCRPPEIQPAGGEAPEQGNAAHDAAVQDREAPAEAAPASPTNAGKNLAAMLEETSIAREALQQELDLAQNALAAAEERAQTAQEELAAEKDRALKLEVELSEMQTKLQGMQELELECRKYKQMLAERERKGSGIWGYVTGA